MEAILRYGADTAASFAGGIIGASIAGLMSGSPKAAAIGAQAGATVAPDVIETVAMWAWNKSSMSNSSSHSLSPTSVVVIGSAVHRISQLPVASVPSKVAAGVIHISDEDEFYRY